MNTVNNKNYNYPYRLEKASLLKNVILTSLHVAFRDFCFVYNLHLYKHLAKIHGNLKKTIKYLYNIFGVKKIRLKGVKYCVYLLVSIFGQEFCFYVCNNAKL